MCTILASTKGVEIPEDFLKQAFDNNPHGCGFMVAKDGDLLIKKGFFKFEEFYAEYQNYIGDPIVIHVRWATSGDKNEKNCHPFSFLEGQFDNKLKAAIAHNGVITGFGYKITGMSDTYAFTEQIIKAVTNDLHGEKWWLNNDFKWFIEEGIGSGNKLCILDSEGVTKIFNESAGHWINELDGVWASNDQYKVVKNRKIFPSTTNYFGGYESDYSFYQTPKNTQNNKSTTTSQHSTTPTITAGASSTHDNFFEISAQELEEIDDWLSEINS